MLTRSIVLNDRRTGEIIKGPFEVSPEEDFALNRPLDQPLWHYVKYEYFQALVSRRELWVNRLDNFATKDPFDGELPEESLEALTPTDAAMRDTGIILGGTKEERLFNANIFRKLTYAHCWTIRRRESARMWAGYCEDTPRSIAIVTTIARLQNSLRANLLYCVPGEVKYVEDSTPRPQWTNYSPAFYKRRRFHKDREWRLLFVVEDPNNEDFHVTVSIYPMVLIQQVVINPMAEMGFRNEVLAFLHGNGVEASVVKSKVKPEEIRAAHNKLDLINASSKR